MICRRPSLRAGAGGGGEEVEEPVASSAHAGGEGPMVKLASRTQV